MKSETQRAYMNVWGTNTFAYLTEWPLSMLAELYWQIYSLTMTMYIQQGASLQQLHNLYFLALARLWVWLDTLVCPFVGVKPSSP